ncbi:MAG: hypothetical protein E7812_09815 [Phenylobacterium sp.]|nr:MAG: hypothetical protein E7812_09815 [Phenylobacterium sp.]
MAGRGKRAAAIEPVAEPWELPDGWIWEPLGHLFTKSTAKHPPDHQSSLRFIGLEHIPPHQMKAVGYGAFNQMRSAASSFRSGDVLYGRLRPYLNKVWVADFHGACSGELLVLRSEPQVLNRYLAYVLHDGRYVAFASHAVAGDRPRLDLGEMANYPVPVPPRDIQERIVARIDELFAEIEKGELAVSDARDALQAQQMAFETHIFDGKFASAAGASDESESVESLLGEIAASAPYQRAKRAGVPVDEAMPRLPEHWRWVRLEQLIHEGPSNGYSPSASGGPTGTPSLKLTATSGGKIRLDEDCVRVLSEKIEPTSPLFLREHDVLFQRGNTRELVGIAAIFNGPPNTYVYPDLMIRVRTRWPWLARWLWRWANSPRGRKYMMESAQGAAGSMPKITGKTVRQMPVPVGPPLQMAEALERLEAGSSTDLSRELEDVSATAARLRQSILAAAFRGDLVK